MNPAPDVMALLEVIELTLLGSNLSDAEKLAINREILRVAVLTAVEGSPLDVLGKARAAAGVSLDWAILGRGGPSMRPDVATMQAEGLPS
jgi:hypothetical protein